LWDRQTKERAALKERDKERLGYVALSGLIARVITVTQGSALGCHMKPFQGKSTSSNVKPVANTGRASTMHSPVPAEGREPEECHCASAPERALADRI
jgi:hypothetical protein